MRSGAHSVVVIDDRAAHGERPSPLGPLVRELLAEAGFHVDATVTVPGDEIEIRNAVNTAVIGGTDPVPAAGARMQRSRPPNRSSIACCAASRSRPEARPGRGCHRRRTIAAWPDCQVRRWLSISQVPVRRSATAWRRSPRSPSTSSSRSVSSESATSASGAELTDLPVRTGSDLPEPDSDVYMSGFAGSRTGGNAAAGSTPCSVRAPDAPVAPTVAKITIR